MKKIISTALLMATILTVRTAYGQLGSAYFQAVTNLNPVVYFPLQDVFTPTWVNDVETNYGTLGQGFNGQDDAVYESQYAVKGNGALAAHLDGSVSFNATAGGFLAVPTADTNTAVQTPKLSVECWVQSTAQGTANQGIISKSSASGAGINGTVNTAGWVLSQNYIAYLDSGNLSGWDFHVFNGIGRAGAEIIVPYNVQNNVSYHLVATFDGTNCRFYVNGVDMVTAGIAIQIPMPAGTHYIPDTWDPLCMGCGRGQNANLYHGVIGDVAIYTNALSAASVNNHYQAALSGPSYDAAVAADNAYMFYHMDSQSYTPPTTTYTAASYGLDSTNYVAVYGTAAVPDASGPQYSGMLDPGNGNQSYSVQINGTGGGNGELFNTIATNPVTSSSFQVEDSVPINVMWATPVGGTYPGGNPLLNPTNHNPFSVSCWFRPNPTDNNRFQSIFGHSDSGWRCAVTTGGGNIHFKPGNNGTEIASDYGYNDGNWHHLVCTFDGTNVEDMYLDGRLSQTSSGNNVVETGSADDVILGGDPQWFNSGNPVTTVPPGVNFNSGYSCRDFSGAIAHFAFWTNVLSAGQVEGLYSNAVPNQTPYIIAQPATGRVNPSPGFLYFATVAAGTPALGFQWYHTPDTNYSDGVALTSGSKYQLTSAANPVNGTLQLVVSNLVTSDSGYYYCIITNYSGSVTTILASLSVNYAPIITAQTPTANFPLYSGQQEDMTVTVSSETNGIVYQWYVNGTADPSGSNSTYLTAPQTTAGSQFYCIVTNSSGSATSMVVSVSQILSIPAVLTNSLFSSNILATGPTAFWPMNETGETPAAGDVETNYGSLGAAGTGVYGDWRSTMQASMGVLQGGNFDAPTNMTILHGIPGAIAGDTDPAECFFASDGSEIIVPHSSSTLTLVPPFTLEAWLRPNNDEPGFGVAIGEHSGAFNATGNSGGFDWLYNGTSNAFSMSVYNGKGTGEGSEPKTSASYPPGQWYHVVTTYDGTNVQYYIDGVADPMTGANGTNGTYAAMAPNYWDPITIGCGRGLGANYWKGSMDEVAIYTNLLPVAEIQKHYNDGTNATYHSYMADVLNDHPALYYRMDAPAWVPPSTNTWPTLINYGSVAINGVYTPNAVPSSGPAPSVDGVTLTGFPANSSFQSDGVMAFGDALNVPAFHPSGKTPFTVAAWMRGFPTDDGARNWQSLVAEGDTGWRMNMNAGNGRANFNAQNTDTGNSTTSGASVTINDGQWHWVVGACDGSNTILYVDGLVSATNKSTSNDNNQNVPIFLAAYPINNTSDANFPTDVAFEDNAAGSGSGRVLAGDLCDAAFWSGTALASNQISSIYQSMDVPPIIDVQPVSANVNQDAGFTNVTVWGGTQPLTYKWYQNGSLRADQTGPSLSLSSVQLTDVATNNGYYVVVNNAYGSATSAVVTLTVNSVPTISQNLNTASTNATVWAGASLSYLVLAEGAVPLYYQWFSNSAAITAASQTGSNIVITAEPGGVTNHYYCVVTNSAGSVTSFVAQVTILALPSAPYVGTIVADHPFGFWRLNELGVNGAGGGPNNGVIAYDYLNGNDGIYTNTALDNPANNPHDTNAASAGFGFSLTDFYDNDAFAIPNVNFSGASNRNFSVECWVLGAGLQANDAGLVSKGYGGGGEQFIIDCGSDGTSAEANGLSVTNPYDHSFRFFVRDTSTNVHSVVSAVNPVDQAWHYLAAVCNESNGYVAFYIDGGLVGTNTITANAGILSSTRNMLIGSRPSNSTTNNNDNQFFGYMQDVAVYPYALTAQQVLNHYDAAEVPATIIRQPTNTVASSGGSATFSIGADGTLPIGYQWWDQNANSPLNGATSATLALNNVTANDSYYCVVTNAYGTNQSQPASLTVVIGAPQLYVNVQPQYLVLEGGSISIPVTAYGTLPISYQWLFDTNTVLQNNYRISGAGTNVLTLTEAQLSDAGTYQCIITNTYGAVTSSIASLVVASVPVNFNSNGVSGNGLGWSASQSGTFTSTEITNGVLILTDNGGSEARSFFFNFPQYIGAFEASFIYTIGGNAAADGMSFCLQNDPRGAKALGGDGGQIGVGTSTQITPSWELEFNMFQNADGVGYNIFTNGIVGVNLPLLMNPGGYSLTNGDNGDPIAVNMLYLNGQMTLTFTDTVNSAGMSTIFPAAIPVAVGGETAYVGFTGGDGGSESVQTISDFSFLSIPTAQILPNSSNATISWPNVIPGYILQESSSLTSPSWANVPNTVIETNGMYEVTVPTIGQTEFYRLSGP